MPTETAVADCDQPSPRRRFQFRLRTLMIGVTLFALIPCGYVGWQAKIVRDRQAWTAHLAARGFVPRVGDVVIQSGYEWQPTFVRRWMGDKATSTIGLPEYVSDEEKETTLRLFPETTVVQTPSLPPQSSTQP
jgi:hypothetical protein